MTCAFKARPNPCMEGIIGYDVLLLAGQVLVPMREGESVFSKSVPSDNRPQYSARPLFQEYKASTIGLDSFCFKDTKLNGQVSGGGGYGNS